MELEPSAKERLKATLSEQERAVFARLHRTLTDTLSRAKSVDPVLARDTLAASLNRWLADTMDTVLSQENLLRQLERALRERETRVDAPTVAHRLAQLKREMERARTDADAALQLYREACAAEVTRDITEHFAAVNARYVRWRDRTTEGNDALQRHCALTVQRDELLRERALVQQQREQAHALETRRLALVTYIDHFERHYDDAYITQKVREHEARDAEHKEARDERDVATKKARSEGEVVDAALCLYRGAGSRLIKFIPASQPLLALYEALSRTDTTRDGFLPVLQTRRIGKLLVPAWLRCDDLGSNGVVAIETTALRAFDAELLGAMKNAEKFSVLYELVHYMAQAARHLGQFLYNLPEIRRLRWVERATPRRYGDVVCAGRRGVVMVDLTQAQTTGATGEEAIYLRATDYALFYYLVLALPVPDFTHKMLALLARHDSLPYARVLDALAGYWAERRV